MKQITNVNPLITNFITPKTPKVVSEDEVKVIYDHQSQVAFYMGGGKSGKSRSNDGYKLTREESPGRVNHTNDAPRYTDD